MLLIKFNFMDFVRQLNSNASGGLRYFHRNQASSNRHTVTIYNTLGLEIDLQYHHVDFFELDLGTNLKSLLELQTLDREDAAIKAAGCRIVAAICNGRRMVFELHFQRLPLLSPVSATSFDLSKPCDQTCQVVSRWKFLPVSISSGGDHE